MTFVRIQCEQSSCVWYCGLTQENKEYLERVQKVALKDTLKKDYKNYKKQPKHT